MSDDTIRLVQSLIDSKKGDADRLQQILNTLQQGTPLDISDQNYLEEISKQQHEDLTTTPEDTEHETFDKQDSSGKTETEDDAHETLEDESIQETRDSPSRKKVAIVAAAIAIIVIAYVGLDLYSASTLQFRPHYGNDYQISPTEIHVQADVCNPSFFPATFNKYEIAAFYNSETIETAQINGSMISPKTMSTVDGVFVLNADAILRLKNENATFDPTLARITTTVDAPIFGIIPFSIVKQYTSTQFQDVLKNGPPGSFSCD